MLKFLKLKKRQEFLRVAEVGEKVVTTTIILQAAQSLCVEQTLPRIGFTSTKKIGKANIRNLARRRMRALIRELSTLLENNMEYVLIARYNTASCNYADIKSDLTYALKKSLKLIKEKNNA